MNRAQTRVRSRLVILVLVVLALTACQSGATGVTPEASPVTQAQANASATPVASATPIPTDPPTSTPEPTATATPAISPTPTATVPPKTIRQTENYLVLGMDQRPGEGAWRTDTIMVVAIDYDASQVGVISIPRDLWVSIPGYGMGRINQADFLGEQQKYPGGGPALAAKVIEDNLGIPSKHWVRLRLEALPELVDALGGVTVTLNCPLHELTPDPKAPDSGAFEHFDLPAGQVLLDGASAAKFARYRYASNDFSRARRQQQLIWAIRDRALQVDAIPKIPELWRTLSKTFKTDLSLLDVIRLARLGSQLESQQVHGLVFSSKAIEYAVVGGGAQVLKVGDRALLEKELAGLFTGQSLAAQGREGSAEKCPTPAPPTSPTPVLTPEATSTSG